MTNHISNIDQKIQDYSDKLVEDVSKACEDYGIEVDPGLFYLLSIYFIEEEVKLIRNTTNKTKRSTKANIIQKHKTCLRYYEFFW